MSEDNGVFPLLEAKRRIESAINQYLEKVALLRKRSDALQQAINVLRSSDEELASLLPAETPMKAPKSLRVTTFNEEDIERRVTNLLAEGGASNFPSLEYNLRSQGAVFSKAGLRRILKTGPQFSITGVRDSTRYSLRRVE